MIEHHSQIDALLGEFAERNPARGLIVRYAEDLEEKTGCVVEVTTPDADDETSEIIIDPIAPLGVAGSAIARCLGVVEAGYDATEDQMADAIEHYCEFAEVHGASGLVAH